MTYKSDVPPQFYVVATGVILSVLFAGNVYFVKRLVDKLDTTEQTVWELKQQIAIMRMTIEDLSRFNEQCRQTRGSTNGSNLHQGSR